MPGRKRPCFLFPVSCFLFPVFAFAFFLSPGESGYNFLKLGIGARPVAMGCAFTAVADDANCLFWNPGGIGASESFDGTLMIMSLFSTVTYGALGIKAPVRNGIGLGIGASLLSAKEIRRDEFGNERGEYYFNNYLLSGGFAFSPGEALSLGFACKWVGSRIDTFFAYSLAADAGILYSPFPNLFFGSSLRHFGTPQRFISGSSMMPTNLRLGIAYKIPLMVHHLLFASDLAFDLDRKPVFCIGGECLLRNLVRRDGFFSLRAGYQTGYHLGAWRGVSFGIGYGYKIAYKTFLIFDLTYLDYGNLGSAERASLSLRFSPPGY